MTEGGLTASWRDGASMTRRDGGPSRSWLTGKRPISTMGRRGPLGEDSLCI